MTDRADAARDLLERMVTEQPTRLPAKMRGAGYRAQDAEDLAQEALVRAVRSIAGVRGPVSEELLCSWVDRIAVNTMRSSRRSSSRRPAPVALDELHSDPPGDSDVAEQVASDEALRWLLIRLPRAQRDAFVGLALEGRSTKEVAQELGVREDTVRWRFRRARTRLAQLVEELDGSVASHPGACRCDVDRRVPPRSIPAPPVTFP